ncbi:hypothetical protein Ahy_A01g001556 isoform D [Arachis hypogaea]|uniref:Uncharacterized protein n=1 Tax=Arachis hypogaea TaxID=3818 RepID=A0A445ENP7_ARAHY|nr:hypothetical protein Ahy_A01g001556 isoform D [Arachis hypogaea]
MNKMIEAELLCKQSGEGIESAKVTIHHHTVENMQLNNVTKSPEVTNMHMAFVGELQVEKPPSLRTLVMTAITRNTT